MANIQIRLEDSLKDKAQEVVENMGMDLSSAIRIFLAQVVKENGLPFRPANDPFHTAKNREALLQSISQFQSGQTVTKSLNDLRSME